LPKLPFPDKSKIISAIGENPRWEFLQL
jgi:hypothetical protein